MDFLRRLIGMFGGSTSRSTGRYLDIYVLSRRCNEPLVGQVDLVNELSRADDDDATYFTRKVLHTTGERRCFAQVEVELFFDRNKKILRHEVTDGRWLTGEEYAAELERFNAPPPEEDEAEAQAAETAEGTQMDAGATASTSDATTSDQSANRTADQPKRNE